MRRAALALALLLGPAASGTAPAQAPVCQYADARPGEARAEQLAEAVVCVLNQERAERGLWVLRTHRDLELVGLRHALDIEEHDHFSHRSRSGRGLARRVDMTRYLPYEGDWQLGENLRWGTGAEATPRAAVRGWLASDSHRENMLDPSFRDVGTGMAHGAPVPGVADSGAATYALELGFRRR